MIDSPTCPKCNSDAMAVCANGIVAEATLHKYDYFCFNCLVGFWSGTNNYEKVILRIIARPVSKPKEFHPVPTVRSK